MSGRKNSTLTAVLLFLSLISWSQVSNNSISQRSMLEVDEVPTLSTTDQSTVEWACINKKLTKKCLIYHNDQWFTFTADRSGELYLNVTNQQCRKKYGVQILLIEGNPCETSSYKLKHCESFTDQSDTFVTLDSLEAGKTYLVNIDGFLGDICAFEIQLATKPIGLRPNTPSADTLQLQINRTEHIVTLEWTTPLVFLDSLNYFEVYRQGGEEFKRKCVMRLPVQYNALGKIKAAYSIRDTLTKHDVYTYSVIGVYNKESERKVLDRKQVRFTPSYIRGVDSRKFIEVSIESKKKTDFDFLVMNKLTGEILFKRQCLDCTSQTIHFDVTREVELGTYHFRVETLNTRTKERSHTDKSFTPTQPAR